MVHNDHFTLFDFLSVVICGIQETGSIQLNTRNSEMVLSSGYQDPLQLSTLSSSLQHLGTLYMYIVWVLSRSNYMHGKCTSSGINYYFLDFHPS